MTSHSSIAIQTDSALPS
nr:unnamed protein product [Callosobruchus chinensis]